MAKTKANKKTTIVGVIVKEKHHSSTSMQSNVLSPPRKQQQVEEENSNSSSCSMERMYPVKLRPEQIMYQRKCPFQMASCTRRTEFKNMPGMFEYCFIRIYHFLQRLIVQAGGLQSCNPITKLIAYLFYFTDLAWSGIDKQYYVKRQAIFGQNFVSVLSVVVSKYDASGEAADSFDARLLTIPQKRGFFLGSTIMDPARQYYNSSNEALVPLFVSDPGATMNPDLPFYQPDHNHLRSYLTQHFLGEKQVKEVIRRQTDGTGKDLLQQFGTSVKGISDRKQIYKSLTDFLPRFLCYTLFDVPVRLIPMEDITLAHTSPKYAAVYHTKLPGCIDMYTKPKIIREAMDRVANFLLEHSRVLKNVSDGPNGMTRESLVEMIHMLFGIAGFQGTIALATNCLTQMPEGYADEVIHDEDIAKLRNAVLECARLDSPVTGSHCIVDDEKGFVTEIGGKIMNFPTGTVLFTGMTIANLDEKRFPNPFVFDPENRDFSKLTSFNSIGESTNPSAPRICPGREVALSAVMLMMKAKNEAEHATTTDGDGGALMVQHDLLVDQSVEIELPADYTITKADDDKTALMDRSKQNVDDGDDDEKKLEMNDDFDGEGVEVIGNVRFNGIPKKVSCSSFGIIPLRSTISSPI